MNSQVVFFIINLNVTTFFISHDDKIIIIFIPCIKKRNVLDFKYFVCYTLELIKYI